MVSTAEALAKLISYAKIKHTRNCVISVLVIDIKGTFDNVYKGIHLKTMSGVDLPETFSYWMSYFLSRQRTSLVMMVRQHGRDVRTWVLPRVPQTHYFCFWFTHVLCKTISGRVVLIMLALLMTLLSINVVGTLIRTLQGCVMYYRSTINGPKNPTPSLPMVISCYSSMFTNPNVDSQENKKKQGPKRLTLPTTSLGKCQTQKRLKFLRVKLYCELKV